MELYDEADNIEARRDIVSAVSRQGGGNLEVLRRFRRTLTEWGSVDANTEQEKSFLSNHLLYLGEFGEKEDIELIKSFGGSNHVVVRMASDAAEKMVLRRLEKQEKRAQREEKRSPQGNPPPKLGEGSEAPYPEVEGSNKAPFIVAALIILLAFAGFLFFKLKEKATR